MCMGDPRKSLETGAQRPSRKTVVAGRTLSGTLTNILISDVLAPTCHLKILGLLPPFHSRRAKMTHIANKVVALCIVWINPPPFVLVQFESHWLPKS